MAPPADQDSPFIVESKDSFFAVVMNNTWDPAWKEFEDSVRNLEKDNRRMQQEIDDLEKIEGTFVSKVREKMLGLKAQMEKYKGTALKAERAGQAREELEAQQAENEERMESMKENLADLEKQIAELQKGVDAANAKLEEYPATKDPDVMSKINEVMEEINKEKMRAKKKRGKSVLDSVKGDDIPTLKKKVAKEEKECSKLEKKMEDLTITIKSLQKKIKAKAGDLANAPKPAHVKDAEGEAIAAEADVASAHKELQAEQARVASLDTFGARAAIVVEKYEDLRTLGDRLGGDLRVLAEYVEDDMPRMVKKLVKKLKILAAENEELVKKYKREVRRRKDLFNRIQELKGNVRVFCRVRPMNSKERAETTMAIDFPDEDEMVVTNPATKSKKRYEFERVFMPGSSQEQVFVDTEPLVTSMMDGYSVCIFAYGQTGSGKTYTMEGPGEDRGFMTMSPNRGVNYRALGELFRIARERVPEYKYQFQVTYLEIYNEAIKDLLVDPHNMPRLDIHMGPEGNYVTNLTFRDVESIDEVVQVMNIGSQHRSVGSTLMNADSSRSHSVLSVYAQGTNQLSGQVAKGKLHLIDLAGSERVGKSGATGAKLKEAQKINQSLSALGDVIASLSNKSSHVPFRNSKLTHLLQDSLGGDSKTLMFCNVGPASTNAGETFCALNFASRVRKVELGANNSSKSSKKKMEAERLRKEMEEQEAALQKLREANVTLMEQANQQIEEKKRNIDDLNTDIEKRQQELADKTSEVGRLQAALSGGGGAAADQLVELSEKLAAASATVAANQEKIAKLDKKLSETMGRGLKANKSVSNLRSAATLLGFGGAAPASPAPVREKLDDGGDSGDGRKKKGRRSLRGGASAAHVGGSVDRTKKPRKKGLSKSRSAKVLGGGPVRKRSMG